MLILPVGTAIPLVQGLPVGAAVPPGRDLQRPAVHLLQSVPEHRPVDLAQHVGPDLDPKIRSYAQYVAVVCGVMDLAQREPVRYDGQPSWVTIGQDVGGIQQVGMPELAQRTPGPVRTQNPGSEDGLVQPMPGEPLDVAAAGGRRRHGRVDPDQALRFIDCDDELVGGGVLADDEDRELGVVDPGSDPDEVCERQFALHRLTQGAVVRMLRV